MTIKETNEFRVTDTIEKPDETPSIFLENRKSKNQIEVPGKILEAQYRAGDSFLFLVTEGNPFEEALYIYYVSSSLQIIDSLELSAMYAEGMLRNVLITSPKEIRFSFFDKNEQWVLTIFSKPKRIFFSNKYPVKRKLSVFHKHWLRLMQS
ncbi:MAG: hypothetical protein KUG76_03275 [Gammaproteobacteria bacterium]|nr:hypothetical protein [Gammaproteobacteria bacterium]